MLFSMSPQLYVKIDGVLKSTVDRAEAKAVYLCDKGGSIISLHSRVGQFPQEDNMAALAAGSFFATQELARLIGQEGFQCVFHQGHEASIYMQNMTSDMLLLVIFGSDSNAGLVRLYAKQAAKALVKIFEEAEDEAEQGTGQGNGGLGMQFEIDETVQPFFRSS